MRRKKMHQHFLPRQAPKSCGSLNLTAEALILLADFQNELGSETSLNGVPRN